MAEPFIDATAQAELVRRGEVSPVELVEEAIARIEGLNPQINAVIATRFDKARAEAKRAVGPFKGVPYVLKDLTLTSAGDPYAAGMSALKKAGYRAARDSYFVERMREAGFVLLGKASTPELGLPCTTEPVAWGPTRNPWDLSRSVGGSSGGSAAAVASGMVAIAHASDGGGSIRIPASACGVVGLRPSRGRVSQGPTANEVWHGLAVELAVTRTVRDTAAVLDIVSGRRTGDVYTAPAPERPFTREVGADPGRLRIGVLAEDPTGQTVVDQHHADAVQSAAATLAELGHQVAEGFPPALRDIPADAFIPCAAALTVAELDHYGKLIGRPLTEDDVEPGTWAIAELGRTIPATSYVAGLAGLRAAGAAIERWWADDDWDLLLTPTIPRALPPLGTLASTKENPIPAEGFAYATFTMPYNVSGQPAISLPLSQSAEGLPIGVQLVAAYGREDLLLRVAAQLEAAMPWADRLPPVRAAS